MSTRRSPSDEEIGSSYDDKLHTAYFLFALSFLVYCTSKMIHFDIMDQLRRINTPSSCFHCVITLTFFVSFIQILWEVIWNVLVRSFACFKGLHLVMNVLYAIPLFIVGFSLKMYANSGIMTFVQMNFVGVLSGVIFAVMETRKPWPTVKATGPLFFYEVPLR